MRKNEKNLKTKPQSFDYEVVKAELNAFAKNPLEDPVLVVSKNNDLLRIVKTNKTYELSHENAFCELVEDLPCDINEIRQFLEYVTEDLTEWALEHINIAEYQRHRKLLRSIGYYFDSLLVSVPSRTPN